MTGLSFKNWIIANGYDMEKTIKCVEAFWYTEEEIGEPSGMDPISLVGKYEKEEPWADIEKEIPDFLRYGKKWKRQHKQRKKHKG